MFVYIFVILFTSILAQQGKLEINILLYLYNEDDFINNASNPNKYYSNYKYNKEMLLI